MIVQYMQPHAFWHLILMCSIHKHPVPLTCVGELDVLHAGHAQQRHQISPLSLHGCKSKSTSALFFGQLTPLTNTPATCVHNLRHSTTLFVQLLSRYWHLPQQPKDLGLKWQNADQQQAPVYAKFNFHIFYMYMFRTHTLMYTGCSIP
jgi:hypothetical protein